MDEFCLWCGEVAIGKHYGYAYCAAHKVVVAYRPEELEYVVIRRLKGDCPVPLPGKGD